MRDHLFELRQDDHKPSYIQDPTKFQIDQARRNRSSELILLFETEETALEMIPLIMEFLWQENKISIAIRIMGPLLHIFFPIPANRPYQDVRFLCGQIKGQATMFSPDDYGKLRYDEKPPVKWTEFLESKQVPAA